MATPFDALKVVFRYAALDGDKFSEVMYYNLQALPTSLPAWVQNYWDKRQAILTSDKRLLSVRIGPAYKVPTRSVRLSRPFRLANNTGLVTARGMMANIDAVVPINTASGHSREFPLRGLDFSRVQLRADGTNNLTLNAAEIAFFTSIMRGGWCMKALQVGPVDAGVPKITALAIATNFLQLTVDLGGPVANGTSVIVAGVKGYKVGWANGTWKVASYDNTTKTLQLKGAKFMDARFLWDNPSGTVRVVTAGLYAFEAFDNFEQTNLDVSTHKSGNPIEGRRGRQSVR